MSRPYLKGGMDQAFITDRAGLFTGDCRNLRSILDDGVVDAIVTDPPYELGFMGKRWDSSGVAFNVDTWREMLRVLKPGGYLLAFGGTRIYHRMTCAIEDAGFEIRDSIHWMYGSGFPKSADPARMIEMQRCARASTSSGSSSQPSTWRSRKRGWHMVEAPKNARLVESAPRQTLTIDEAIALVKSTAAAAAEAQAAHEAAARAESAASLQEAKARLAANRAFEQLEIALGRKGARCVS